MKRQLASILLPLLACASLSWVPNSHDPVGAPLGVEPEQPLRICGTATYRGKLQDPFGVLKPPGIEQAPEEDEAANSFQAYLERAVNQATYESVYLTQKESLMGHHAGDWIAIVKGKLLPVGEDGRTAPKDSLEELLPDIADDSKNTHHRFVFRVGEEGEIRYRPTVNDNPEWIGSSLLGCIQGDLWIAPNGVFVAPKRIAKAHGPGPGGSKTQDNNEPDNVLVTPKGTPFEGGTKIGPGIHDGAGPKARLFLHAPDGSAYTPVDATVSTGFQGFAVCGNDAAQAIGLALWEIPGSLDMGFQSPLRRARVHVTTRDGEFLDVMSPLGIWADR